MQNLYQKGTANYPRLGTDTFFLNNQAEYCHTGLMENVHGFVLNNQLLKPELWARFVEQYRVCADNDYGWRGEMWGKMMRGACFTYATTKNKQLYAQLEQTVKDMISVQKQNGRLSTYPEDLQFTGWDLWSRKYVMLGMQYFLEICDDEALKSEILTSVCKQADDILAHVGPGKIQITAATRHWRGLNSCSILEPMVRLYSLTGEQRYFDFAQYIVDCGGTDVFNIFTTALENKMFPYQYPITKAYEMMSCFEGLLEFYRVTKIEQYKTSVINFVDKVLESDFTVIGCCGCTHELFDHSKVRQANTNNEKIMQETCVTVTIMKLLSQVHLLTGDPKYMEAFETSAYNAYLGSMNTENICDHSAGTKNFISGVLPFDSYSPLTAGVRGVQIGGLMRLSDNHFYGCCACIGSAGNGLIPQMALLNTKNGFAFNLWLAGQITTKTLGGQTVCFNTVTEYPKNGNVQITVQLEKPEEFEILLRNPSWSRQTKIEVCGKTTPATAGYTKLKKVWQNGDTITIQFAMDVQVIRPIPYGSQILNNKVIWGHNYVVPTFDEEDPKAKYHVALRRGPIVLAQDNRLGYNVDDAVPFDEKMAQNAKLSTNEAAKFDHILEVTLPLANGESIELVDYASAGKLWNDESKMAAWLLIQ